MKFIVFVCMVGDKVSLAIGFIEHKYKPIEWNYKIELKLDENNFGI